MKKIIIATIAGTMLATSAMAASISTYPMRVELEEGSGIGELTVFNAGDKPANIQVRAMAWSQDAKTGAEDMQETRELIFFPKIFSVPAKGQQVIRVGYQQKVGDKEKSFRVFVRELPVDEPGQTGARFAVQISSPAFIYPKGAVQPTKPTVDGIEVAEGKLMARVSNSGARYYSMNKLEINGSKGGKEVYKGEVAGWYVLAGVSKLFPLNVSRVDCQKMDSVHLIAHTQTDKNEVNFPVDAALCGKITVETAAKQ
ncbi:MAG: hypothetical protein CO187_03695 [Zetaproteobacteria bacterium CG_4_9_14_3_um_filter_53_7]|nr:MAG: hypothetical protein CO187_03695 [Zetaproteobacteria bacterium CG_4_9_14_3_um_filter_53_7]